MPSLMHEGLVEMFRHQPALAAMLLADPLDIPVPSYEKARLSSNDLNEVKPTEYRADAVVALISGGKQVGAVIVEVQLRIDPRKPRRWPAYVANLYARLGCPVILLVVCTSRGVARRSAKPIVIGHPGLVLTPLVVGPHQVPVVTDPEEARRSPGLAVLSAMAHGAEVGSEGVFDALLSALTVVDADLRNTYIDIVRKALPTRAQLILEELMKTSERFYVTDYNRAYWDGGKAEGKAEGEARAVVRVLEARGIEVPPHLRQEILGCTDLDRLESWLDRASTAEKIDELFV